MSQSLQEIAPTLTTKTASRINPSKPFLSLFINRNFGLLLVGQTISDVGDTIYLVTLSLWIAVILAKSQPWGPVAVSGLMIAMGLPALTFGPLAGVFVDRWNKQSTMVRMDIIRTALLLLLLPLTGLVPLPFVTLPLQWKLGAIYSVAFVASVCGQFFSPARFTILSEILPEKQRARASAMQQSAVSVVKIIGPVLAAPLLFTVGVQWALIVDALSFVISFLSILLMQVPDDTQKGNTNGEKMHFLHEFTEGLRFFRRSRLLLTLLVAVLIATLGTGAFDALLVFFFQKNLHASTGLFGTLIMAIGAGSVFGALAAAPLVARFGAARMFWITTYIMGILLILFARQHMLLPALFLLFWIGLPLGVGNTALGPLLMQMIPHDLMGRVRSVYTTSQMLCNLISIFAAGLLGTLLEGFHTTVLGVAIGAYDTIYVGIGVLFLLGATYAMLNLQSTT